MTDKKPNQGKKGKKPALSSSSGKPQNTPAENKPVSPAQGTQATSAPAKPAATSTATAATRDAKRTVTSSVQTAANTNGSGNSGSSKSWVAPVALLFGLLGTGFSAYLYSQLKSLAETTSTTLQSTAEAAKTDVASVQTALDEKADALATELEEKTSTINSTLEEKTAALSTALEEQSAAINSTLEEKTTALSGALEEKTTALSGALDEKTSALAENLSSTSETLRGEAENNKSEIATSTASAVQELTSKTELEINNVSTSFNTGLALLRERNTEKFTDLDQRFQQLDESVRTTNELAMRGQRDWVLAEVNYLLRTGVHRVKLAGDVKAGVIALESASDRLHTLGDINYLPVREQIAEEVSALRRVGPPDIEGLIFKLQHMSKRADTLPLPPTGAEKVKAALAEDPATATKALGQSLLDRLKGSVEIVPSDGAAAPAKRSKRIKPTKEQLTASDSLRLHIQAARLSALRHDSENFTGHMDNAIKYSEQIFDTESEQVKTFVNDLTDIRETNIVPSIPILGSSLSLFTKIDAKRGEN